MGWCDRVARSVARGAALLAAVPLLAGCGLLGGPKALRQEAQQVMTVTSPVFGQGVIPRQYTCHGRGESPPIYWSGAPPGTKALALAVHLLDRAGYPRRDNGYSGRPAAARRTPGRQ